MSKIYISTNPEKAKCCFDEDEFELCQRFSALLHITPSNSIQQFFNTQLYFHYDTIDVDITIDKYSDILIKHNLTHANFDNKFLHKKYSNHNENKSNKFRNVFLILLDDSVLDKYLAIKQIIFPDFNSQLLGIIGGQFVEFNGVEKEQIKTLIGENYTQEIESIILLNQSFCQKKSNGTLSKEEEEINNTNWYILEKKLKASYG